MLKLLSPDLETGKELTMSLDDIAREGARQMLIKALQLEVSSYIDQNKGQRDSDGHSLVTRNGKAKGRSITVGSGTIEVTAPRVRDKREGEKFTSAILPPYLRKSPNVESVIPILYLKGLSTSDFKSALSVLFGDGVKGLSPASIVSLKKSWEREFAQWKRRSIIEDYVYIWADGVNVSIRLGEDKKLCLLVIIGVNPAGDKHLLAVEPGYRESKDSWRAVLFDLQSRGFKAPLLAVADGALGFWSALRETDGFQSTKEARCWVHKIANVLDKLPKRLRYTVKEMLHEMMYAEAREAADDAKKKFDKFLELKYPKAVECVDKDWEQLTAFFNFPAQHWQFIRTTNAIESTFSTVKLRTRVTKGAGSATAAATMAFKLLEDAQKRWRRIRGFREIKNLLNGVDYRDGIMLTTQSVDQEESAA